MIEEYNRFINHPNNNEYKQSHGLSIIKVIGCEVLDEMNQLNEQNLNNIITNKFISFIIINIKNQYKSNISIGINQFKQFFSYLYFLNNRDFFSDIFFTIITPQIVQNYFDGNIDFENFQDNNENDGGIAQEKNDEQEIIEGNQQQQEQEQERKEQNELKENQSIEEMLEERQNYFKQLEEECHYINDPISELYKIQQKRKDIQFKEDFFLVNNSFVYFYDCTELSIPQINSPPQSTKKQAQTRAAKLLLPYLKFYLKYNHSITQNNELYLEHLLEQESLKKEEEEKQQQLIIQQQLQQEQIQKDDGEIEEFKEEDGEIEEQQNDEIEEYQQDEQNEEQEQIEIDENSEEYKELEKKFNQLQDILLFQDYADEIIEVNELLSKNLGKEQHAAVKINSIRQNNGLFQCKLTFNHLDYERYNTSALGINKKMAKSIAYMKLYPFLVSYFRQINGSYYTDDNQPKKSYSKRRRNSDDGDNDNGQEQSQNQNEQQQQQDKEDDGSSRRQGRGTRNR